MLITKITIAILSGLLMLAPLLWLRRMRHKLLGVAVVCLVLGIGIALWLPEYLGNMMTGSSIILPYLVFFYRKRG